MVIDPGNLVQDDREIPTAGLSFGESEVDRLFKEIKNEVIPDLKNDNVESEYFTKVASYFLVTHGLIEDQSVYILERESSGNYRDTSHKNNIKELEKHNVINKKLKEKMEKAYKDRKKHITDIEK